MLGDDPEVRLEVFKALGDNTRYAIYLELARSSAPLATADIAETLDLHVNTVRPHLERMRELGLLELHVEASGGVGRPQHRYSLAPDAPSLGLEPPVYPMLAQMLVRMATDAGISGDEAADAGRLQGAAHASRVAASAHPVDALCDDHETMGFDPAVAEADDSTTIAFAHCPFAELAEADPELVCGLHRGMVEGFVDRFEGCDVGEFHTLVHPQPCQVDLIGAAVH